MNKKGQRKQKALTGYRKECVKQNMEKYDEYMYVEYHYNGLEYPKNINNITKIKEKYKGMTPEEAIKYYFENNNVIKMDTRKDEYCTEVPILPKDSLVDFKTMVKIGDYYFIDFVKKLK